MDVSSGGGIVKIDGVAPPSYPFTSELDSTTEVTIEAVPNFGHVFNGWSGDLSGTDNPALLVMHCDKNITATFSVDWTLISLTISSLLMVGLLVTAVIIRRRAG